MIESKECWDKDRTRLRCCVSLEALSSPGMSGMSGGTRLGAKLIQTRTCYSRLTVHQPSPTVASRDASKTK